MATKTQLTNEKHNIIYLFFEINVKVIHKTSKYIGTLIIKYLGTYIIILVIIKQYI